MIPETAVALKAAQKYDRARFSRQIRLKPC